MVNCQAIIVDAMSRGETGARTIKTAFKKHPFHQMGYYSKREITIWAYIYILTNPSFPQYVKIGYAADVKQRLDELNRSPAVPFAFRVYATYEVDSALSDKKLHTILDKLNPELRSMEEVDGEKRIREFYAMTPEDAYAIMEAIAEINGYKHRLKKWKATSAEQKDEAMAQEISEAHQECMAPFTFSMCNIAVGEEVEFWRSASEPSGIMYTVADDKRVEYDGQNWSLTALAKYLLGVKWDVAGPKYFKYKGEGLNDIRRRLGVLDRRKTSVNDNYKMGVE